MKIIFIANTVLDNWKASSYQTLCQSQAIGKLVELKLFLPNRFIQKKQINIDEKIKSNLNCFDKLSFEYKLLNFLNITEITWLNQWFKFTISNFCFALSASLNAIISDCEIIYTRDFFCLLVLSIIKTFRLTKKKLAFESHQYSLPRAFLIKNFDYLITINKFQKKLYQHPNSIILHDSIWEKDIIKSSKKRILERSILYAGSCKKSKGIERLLNLADKIPDYDFYIANIEDFKQDNININLKRNNIFWLGRLNKEDLKKLIDKVEFCILPNDPLMKENFYTSPMKLFEYMARGKALILSPIETVLEIMPDKSYIDLGKSDSDLDKAVGFIRKNNSFELSKNSLNIIKNFTWEKRAEDLYKFFKV